MTLCALYCAQGIPWGFVTVTLLAWLARPENNFTTEQLGPIVAVAALPWSFKFFWGPVMDRFSIPRFGRRRPWIIFAQSMAILVLGMILLFDDLPSMVWTETPADHWFWNVAYQFAPGPLLLMILVANIFVSIQDVAVDALAVDLLNEDERGVANGLMYGSSYFGTAVGGAGLGWVVSMYGIRAGLIGQTVLLGIIMLLPLIVRERPSDSQKSDSEKSDSQKKDSSQNPNELVAQETKRGESIVKNLVRAFSLRSTILGAVMALGVRVGIGVLTAVFVDYLIKDGGWSQEEYTTTVGGYAVGLGLVGSVSGGFLADRAGTKSMILLSSFLLGALWIGFGMTPTAIDSKTNVQFMLLAQEFLLAVMSVSLFALFMGISWPKVAATQFTTYMALMNFSTTIGSYAAGYLDLRYTIFQILIVAGLTQIALSLPVLLIDPQETRRRLKA